ncbi:suppressor protein SRP40-like [Solanum dulcamara]|uniref:suppressor protein SRP40-like n=1 Tax=Solanum dulcamara TaxID=45834 RepID=UPI002485F106|nr:suppressor protein SRP40-like [Solanum dulcamara]
MSSSTPVELFKPPDQSQKLHNPQLIQTHQVLSPNSNHISSNLQEENDIAISNEDLNCAQKCISLQESVFQRQKERFNELSTLSLYNTLPSLYTQTATAYRAAGMALRRPPESVQEERLSPRNKTQLESTPSFCYNTATPVEISKEQLAWAQKIISWSQNRSNGETQGKDAESDSKQLDTQQISNDFTLPIGKSGDTQGDSDTESGSSNKEFSNSDENFLNLKRFDTVTQNVEDSASVSTGVGNASQERISKQSNIDIEETTRSNIQINPSKSVSIPIEHKSKEVTHSVHQEVKNNKENKGENELNPIAIETDTQDNIGKHDACNNSTKINHNNSASNKTQLPHDLTKLTSNFVKHNPQYKPNIQNSNDKPPTKPKQLP